MGYIDPSRFVREANYTFSASGSLIRLVSTDRDTRPIWGHCTEEETRCEVGLLRVVDS